MGRYNLTRQSSKVADGRLFELNQSQDSLIVTTGCGRQQDQGPLPLRYHNARRAFTLSIPHRIGPVSFFPGNYFARQSGSWVLAAPYVLQMPFDKEWRSRP